MVSKTINAVDQIEVLRHICTFFKVKVYLTSVDEDGQTLNTFDVQKIKVNVVYEDDDSDDTPAQPVVREESSTRSEFLGRMTRSRKANSTMKINRSPEKKITDRQLTQKPRIMKPVVKLRQLSNEEILKWTSNSNENSCNATGSEIPTSSKFLGLMTRSRKANSTMEINRSPEKTITDRQSTKKRKSNCSLADNLKCKKRKVTKNTIIETIEIENATDDQSNDNESNETKTPSNPKNVDAPSVITTVAVNPFVVGEVIWGKIRGWPHWPAKIVRLYGRLIEVEWFNDYRTTKLYKSQIFKFYPNYDIFAEKFDTSVGLKTAATDALLYITSKL